MSVRTIPGERFRDMGADVTYERLNRAAVPTVIVEPETIGAREWVDADMAAILATGAVGTFGTLTVGADINIPAQGRLALLETPAALPATTPATVQVLVGQRNASCIFGGRVKLIDSGGGAMVPVVEITAFNLTAAALLIPATTQVTYVILRREPTPAPMLPNTALLVTPGNVWAANEPITVAALNTAARPTAAFAPGSIGQAELNSSSFNAFASANAGKRGSYTLAAPLVVTTLSATTVSTLAVPGAVVAGSVVRVRAQPAAPTPLFTGYVSAANTVTLQVRRNNAGTANVPAGTILKVVVFQP